MKTTKRYIITGSRDFPNQGLVERVVSDLVLQAHKNDEAVIIVHGACKTGADRFADDTAKRLQAQGYPVDIEAHPADWTGLSKGAGPVRNAKMAALGAVRTLAFWDGDSAGTLDMIRQSVRHKILVTIYPA